MNSISLKQFNRILLCGILVCVILYFAKKVLIPVAFAAFLAMLFAPLCTFLEKHRVKRVLTSLLSIILTLGIGAGIVMLTVSQGQDMFKNKDQMKQKAEKMVQQGQQYITAKFDIPQEKQEQILQKQMKSLSESSGSFLKKSAMGFADFLTNLVLVIIFLFLFLLQREKYEAFFVKLSRDAPASETQKLLENITKVSAHYLRGRIFSILIFTACFTLGFTIVGLKNAFLLAFVSALLTIVPYVGSIVGGLLPFAVALVTEDSSNTALGALVVVLIVQGIDNYFVEPYIIGGQVSLSGFSTILILVIGGLLWGVAGMILFIPMLGVFKIICDNVPALQPYGFLIGDQEESTGDNKLVKWFRKKFGSQKDNQPNKPHPER